MNHKILLTGKNGQLGDDLRHVLSRLGDVVATDRQQFDLSRPDEIRKKIRELQPTLIVNAAAYTAVDQAEKDEAAARAINSQAPAIMAEEAKKIGAALVHYSTDYVFDGSKNSPYDEDDPPNPISVYGATKLAGEQAIRDSGVDHLIFRTAWVYSTRGKNFLLTILRLATQREELRIVRDQIGAPTWSREIAGATVKTLEQICNRTRRNSSVVRAQRYISHDCRRRDQLVRVYSRDPAGSRASARLGGVVSRRDQRKGTADPPGAPHHYSRISHAGAPSCLFGSLQFETKSNLWNSVARLAPTIEAGVLF